MKKNLLMISSCAIITLMISFNAQAQVFSTQNSSGIKTKAATASKNTSTSSSSNKASGNGVSISSLTNGDMSKGLKDALELGITNATNDLSAMDGFYKNPTVKILFPPEVQDVEKKLRALGMGNLVDDAILKMNRAAEGATSQAVPILFDAVGSITVTDAAGIVTGGNTSATQFLKRKSTVPLSNSFTPIVEQSLNQTGATVAWKTVFDAYNKIPFIKPVNSNLTNYVTEKTIDALFTTIGEEEIKIRKNPGQQGSNMIQKVFGAK